MSASVCHFTIWEFLVSTRAYSRQPLAQWEQIQILQKCKTLSWIRSLGIKWHLGWQGLSDKGGAGTGGVTLFVSTFPSASYNLKDKGGSVQQMWHLKGAEQKKYIIPIKIWNIKYNIWIYIKAALCATDVTVERRRAKDSCRIRTEQIRPMCDNIIAKIRIMCDNTLYCMVLALFVFKLQMQ